MLETYMFKSTYSSDEDSLLLDFYIPALGLAARYDRAVGYFSSSTLSYALQGIDGFLKNQGRMRLVIGTELDEDEYEAVKEGNELRALFERLGAQLDDVAISDNELLSHRLRLLSYLIARGRLEIKLAIRKRGIFHEKIGYMEDTDGNAIAFQGSANETTMAYLPEMNGESISVYPSWNQDVFRDYALPIKQRFERLWNNRSKQNVVVALPSELYERLRKLRRSDAPPPEIEGDLYRLSLGESMSASSGPELPRQLGSQPYELKDHQKSALAAWKASSFQGIFALATGAGKTVTALHGAVQIAKARETLGRKTALVVAVPYQILADQWCEVMRAFNMEAIPCYRSRSYWKTVFEGKIANFLLYEDTKFLCAVVVNATLITDDFQSALKQFDPKQLIFVGDECHHHASEKIIRYLPEAAYRIGLSATPWSRREEARRTLLTGYYGNIVAQYSIAQALEDQVLSPYEYFVHTVNLSLEESTSYEELSGRIARLLAIKSEGGRIDEDELNMLLMARARVIGSAEDKFRKLASWLSTAPIEKHTLFYCGDGSVDVEDFEAPKRDVQQVATVLRLLGWKTSRVTAEESLVKRRTIIEEFKDGYIDALVAIRVLDEGFDIPACRQAFLLASSRNERQFIQRRGRILRRSPGKTYSTIHDFIVLPSQDADSTGCFQDLVKKELVRAIEFARVCQNEESVRRVLNDLAAQYDIDVVALEEFEFEEQD